jgi:hypothetical protein
LIITSDGQKNFARKNYLPKNAEKEKEAELAMIRNKKNATAMAGLWTFASHCLLRCFLALCNSLA